MQGAADGMLREALDCYDDGAIEEGDLSVIGLALEQFHHAVADRRAVIGAGGAGIAADARPPDADRAWRLFPSILCERSGRSADRGGGCRADDRSGLATKS